MKDSHLPVSSEKEELIAKKVRSDVEEFTKEIQELYLLDEIPWVVGYSGGKDSTSVLQLVWSSISQLPQEQRQKEVHVVSTDTLVENPIISLWVRQSLEKMRNVAVQNCLPFFPHQLYPKSENSFWVNLIGRGYPAPRQRFRWCTDRLKIHPSNEFVRNVVRENGETILVLGIRRGESSNRTSIMNKLAEGRILDRLSPNPSLPNSRIYSPIESWKTEHVWLYLLQWHNPWGHSNKELFEIYRGATEDNDCPLVIDTSTPSCGSSRFGCWVCTMVDQDKSMQAMILNDESKEWMQPLLDFRDELDFRSDEKREAERQNRDFRRITGSIQLFERKRHDTGDTEVTNVPGPYLKYHREYLLRRLLETQVEVQQKAPADMQDIELISLAELREIRRIWLDEKHEFDDALPRIYQEVLGREFKDPRPQNSNQALGPEEWQLLEEICGDEPMHFELIRKLLSTEDGFSLKSRRNGILGALENCLDSSSRSETEAVQAALTKRKIKEAIKAEDANQIKELTSAEPEDVPASSWAAMKFKP